MFSLEESLTNCSLSPFVPTSSSSLEVDVQLIRFFKLELALCFFFLRCRLGLRGGTAFFIAGGERDRCLMLGSSGEGCLSSSSEALVLEHKFISLQDFLRCSSSLLLLLDFKERCFCSPFCFQFSFSSNDCLFFQPLCALLLL
ncbi:unnamed protein product [Haemonchus placei]|uniref:Uncharacterized protein n=1 Tax=Haemonchus placei TaxID=6290 RepID=A0A0N4WWG6_HAEPC|nr:unnamed protein product [Haemonchus placei]